MGDVRIKSLDMTIPDVFAELSRYESGGYNPGALSVLMQIWEKVPEIDPDCMIPLLTILSLDTHKIYAERIWMFYKDVCGQDLTKMLGVLRAVQLGLLPEREMTHAIDNRGNGLDIEQILANVRGRLPRFGATQKT